MAAITLAAPPTSAPWWRHLYAQVLIAIALGTLVGWLWPDTGAALKPLGDAFIKLVKMVIAPVIFLTVVTGIAHMRAIGEAGRVAAKAFAYFITVSTLALIVGLIVANTVQPGAGLHINPRRSMPRRSPTTANRRTRAGWSRSCWRSSPRRSCRR